MKLAWDFMKLMRTWFCAKSLVRTSEEGGAVDSVETFEEENMLLDLGRDVSTESLKVRKGDVTLLWRVGNILLQGGSKKHARFDLITVV